MSSRGWMSATKTRQQCVLLRTIGIKNKYYLVDEYFNAERTTEQHAAEIQKLIDRWDIDYIYIDSAQLNKQGLISRKTTILVHHQREEVRT